MKLVEWSMQGTEFTNCNCGWGCPCQFNQNPTHGDCRAYIFVQIEKGRFGDVPLDGLRWCAMFSWPGAIHEGHGTCQSIIDERANPEQRAALEAISHGKETEPGRLIWQVFSTTVEEVKPTLYRAIDLNINIDARTAHGKVEGLIEGKGEPIPKIGVEGGHRIKLVIPEGFEFTEAEVISGSSTATAELDVSFKESHAHVVRFHWGTHGVVC
jgi:hypothetical protein